MELFGQFHFLRPLWLVLIPAVIVLCLLLRQYAKNTGDWQRFIDPAFLDVLLESAQYRHSRVPLYLLAVTLVGLSLALAGPTWEKRPQALKANENALVILWDLSPSMKAEDIAPSRVERARLKLMDLLSARRDGYTGLVVYAGDAHVVTPLTDDTRTIKSLLPSLHPDLMPVQGANIERALSLAYELFDSARATGGDILILTDGIAEGALPALKSLARAEYPVTVWGIGTFEGAPIPTDGGHFERDRRGDIVIAKLDEGGLAEAAIAMKGRYVSFTQGDSDIRQLQTLFTDAAKDTESKKDERFDQWYDSGPWLLFPALFLVAILFRRGWLLALLCTGGLLQPPPVVALSFDSLFKNDNQRGESHFDAGEYEQAAELFEDPAWQAAAAYKAGRYAEAETFYRTDDSAEGRYNLGNSLAAQGKLDEAIAAYDAALEARPDFEEAEDNKALVEALKQAQEQQQEQENQSGSSDNNAQQGNEAQQQSPNQDDQSSGTESESDSSEGDSPASEESGASEGSASSSSDGEQSEQAQSPQNTAANDKNAEQAQQEALQRYYGDEKAQAENQSEQDALSPEPEDSREGRQAQAQNLTESQADDNRALEPGQQSQAALLEGRQSEADQALEQWLRKVPDDPGGLLRNKFELQHRQRRMERPAEAWRVPPDEEQRW